VFNLVTLSTDLFMDYAIINLVNSIDCYFLVIHRVCDLNFLVPYFSVLPSFSALTREGLAYSATARIQMNARLPLPSTFCLTESRAVWR